MDLVKHTTSIKEANEFFWFNTDNTVEKIKTSASFREVTEEEKLPIELEQRIIQQFNTVDPIFMAKFVEHLTKEYFTEEE
jgi:hypothetical protein